MSGYRDEKVARARRRVSLDARRQRVREALGHQESLRREEACLSAEIDRLDREVAEQVSWVDRLRVSAPCPVPWDGMTGDERVRHCRLCDRQVFNFAAMGTEETAAVLRGRKESICVRLRRRPDRRTVMEGDCPPGRRIRNRRRVVGVVGGAAAVGITAVAGASGFSQHSDVTSKERSPKASAGVRPVSPLTPEEVAAYFDDESSGPDRPSLARVLATPGVRISSAADVVAGMLHENPLADAIDEMVRYEITDETELRIAVRSMQLEDVGRGLMLSEGPYRFRVEVEFDARRGRVGDLSVRRLSGPSGSVTESLRRRIRQRVRRTRAAPFGTANVRLSFPLTVDGAGFERDG